MLEVCYSIRIEIIFASEGNCAEIGDAVIPGGWAMAGRMSGEECETGPRNADNSPCQVTSTSTSVSMSNDVAKERSPIEERLAAKMLSYESVCFILALSFTALAALHSS